MTPERLAKLAAEAAQTGLAVISKAEVAEIEIQRINLNSVLRRECTTHFRHDDKVGRLEAEIDRLKVALADAIHRPMGVIPASAEGLLSDAELIAGVDRRPRRQPTPTGDA